MKHKTTILVDTTTRDLLKKIGRKDETYDRIIMRLVRGVKRNDE